MARTVSRGEARDRGGLVAVAVFVAASILLIALLASRQGPKAPAPGFPPAQAVPVSVTGLARLTGAGTIGWLLPVPLSGPRDVAVTSAGTVWITEQDKGAVDAFLGGKLLRYEVDAKFPSSGAFALSSGPTDSMWFTGYPNGNIGRMLPDGTVNSFSAVADTSETVAAAQALDGSMWVTDVNLGVVIRIDTQGRVAAFAVPPPTSVQERVGPYDIARAADGMLWFTDPRTRSLGTIAAGGGTPTIREYRVTDGSDPRSIAAGPDGTMWVTFPKAGIGRVDGPGSVRTYPVPAAPDPINNIALAKDGSIWLTTAGRTILHVRPDGSLIRRFTLPGGAVGADGISIAPDGTVWAAATDANMLVEIPNHSSG